VANSPNMVRNRARTFIVVEIAAEAELLQLKLAGAEGLGRPDDGVIPRVVEVRHVMNVQADIGREELRVEHRCFVAR